MCICVQISKVQMNQLHVKHIYDLRARTCENIQSDFPLACRAALFGFIHIQATAPRCDKSHKVLSASRANLPHPGSSKEKIIAHMH